MNDYEFTIEGDYYDGPWDGSDKPSDPNLWRFFETCDLIDNLNGPYGTTLVIKADTLEAATREARERLGALAGNAYGWFTAALWWQNPPDAPCRRVYEWG